VILPAGRVLVSGEDHGDAGRICTAQMPAGAPGRTFVSPERAREEAAPGLAGLVAAG